VSRFRCMLCKEEMDSMVCRCEWHRTIRSADGIWILRRDERGYEEWTSVKGVMLVWDEVME